MYKLSEYAKRHGVHYITAYKHFKKGLISGAYQLPSGTIVIPDHDIAKDEAKTEHIVVYARVSSSQNRKNLESQADRMVKYCNAKGWSVAQIVKETGSGLNDDRPKLMSLLKKGQATRIVVEHKDRLARFGVPFIAQACERFGCEIHVVNPSMEGKEELMNDFVAVVTSFCARLYGQRRGKRKTESLIKELKSNIQE